LSAHAYLPLSQEAELPRGPRCQGQPPAETDCTSPAAKICVETKSWAATDGSQQYYLGEDYSVQL